MEDGPEGRQALRGLLPMLQGTGMEDEGPEQHSEAAGGVD